VPTLFPYPPGLSDSDETIVEGIAYETEVLTAESGAEQRIQLRGFPAGFIEYSILNLDALETTAVLGLLRMNHAEQWWVPLWQYSVGLSSAITLGATVLPIPGPGPGATPAMIPWQAHAGELHPSVLVLRSPTDYDVVRYASVSGSGITVLDPCTASPAGTPVIPLRLGRLDSEFSASLDSAAISSARLRWTLEGTAD
jgi:hypothetical protein